MTVQRRSPIRVVLAKVGLDGHDRGIKLVARGLRDYGMEVIYPGLWQSPQATVRAVDEEDADVLGISLLSGAHLTLVPALVEALKQRGLDDVILLVGGIIPNSDVPKLLEMGVAQVFGPGTSLEDIARFVDHATAGARRGLPQRAREGPDVVGPAAAPLRMEEELGAWIARFRQRDRRALARLITFLEDGELAVAIRQRLALLPQPAAPRPPTLGITGSAGAGKSTLIAALVRHLRYQSLTVGVLACDPQSPVSGGAFLGDRLRMRRDPDDEGVYFRSLSTRGAPGGLSAVVRDACQLLAAFGFDCLLVETIGVGQDEVGIRAVADVVAVLLTPSSGDEFQWLKAGLLEVADLIVVNKADLPGADELAAQLRHHFAAAPPGTRPRPAPEVLTAISARGQGVAELWEAVQRRFNIQ